MPRLKRKSNYRNPRVQKGDGVADIIKTLVQTLGPHMLPLISSLLSKPAEQVSQILGDKVKSMFGKSQEQTKGGWYSLPNTQRAGAIALLNEPLQQKKKKLYKRGTIS